MFISAHYTNKQECHSICFGLIAETWGGFKNLVAASLVRQNIFFVDFLCDFGGFFLQKQFFLTSDAATQILVLSS